MNLVSFSQAQFTWGLQAVKAVSSAYTGNGVRVAVLDSGFDLNHPDFLGLGIGARSASFLSDPAVQDANGHGTHCAGTLCGPVAPQVLPRYGVAPAAELWVGKVLDKDLKGDYASLHLGINWAIANGCRIVSMSLGEQVRLGDPFSVSFEIVAQGALAAGTLLIAAAGNDSWRPNTVAPVESPADCPSIMCVGAIDSQMGIASFSDAGLNPNAGVDLVAPGVDVYSSWRLPSPPYRSRNGTSMAVPHVAGVAALWVEAQNLVGLQLWAKLVQTAQVLPLSAVDAGAGLVQAP
jgi:subtilisin family serine protease